MQKLKLCYECELALHCDTICEEAAELEKEDQSKNYSTEKYIHKPTEVTGFKIPPSVMQER